MIGSMDPRNGGPGQGIRNMIPELDKHGVDTTVISMDDPGAEFLEQDTINIVPMGPGGRWAYSPRLMPWLAEHINDYDIVIVHGLWQYHNYAVVKTAKKLKAANALKPRIYIMPHGMLDPYFQKARERRLKAVRNWLYWKMIESGNVSTADGVLFTCEEELLLAREAFSPYKPKHEINISYGIKRPPLHSDEDKRAFLEKCPQVRNRPFLLFLSRIHQKKGVDLMLEAYAKVYNNEAGNGSFPALVIAGPGLESPFGSKITQIIRSDNFLDKNVFLPGMLSGESKWGAFYACEAFILPSHQENFGIAVVEAMACSKAVMITNKVNIYREIVDGGAGFAANDDLQGITSLMARWKDLPSVQKEASGSEARRVFESQFSVEQAATRFVQALSTKNKDHQGYITLN